MKLSLGIVGLPNVGKSTLFNALTNNNVPAENYPFNTIDPNVGVVPVMDPRLGELTKVVKPAKETPAVVEFWDIAGLVKGAAAGEGLGNQFLANIRNVSAIVHVVRAFKDDNVTHVENSIDPERDIELINAELILKDIETVEKKLHTMRGQVRANPKDKPLEEMLDQLVAHFNEGKLAVNFPHSSNKDVEELRHSLFLLTDKPLLYVANCEESKAAEAVEKIKRVVDADSEVIALDNRLEYEISTLAAEERQEYLQELGLNEPGLAKLTRAAYSLLGLISYFTAGEQETRAWTIRQGTKAQAAAGEIHTDFAKKFIAAEVCAYQDFLTAGGWLPAREQGKVRLEGKEYTVQDGDVVLFKIGA